MDLINMLAGDKSALLASGFVDDFNGLNSTDGIWNTLDADSASAITIDADGLDGRCQILTGTTDNDAA